MTSKTSCYIAGRDRGFECGKCAADEIIVGESFAAQDLEELTELFDDDHVTKENMADVLVHVAYCIEEGNRDFSPFEHVAHAINSEDSDLWDDYDAGIAAGIKMASRFYKSGRLSKMPHRLMCAVP